MRAYQPGDDGYDAARMPWNLSYAAQHPALIVEASNAADIVAAIALGARFTLVGRAYLYGLMAGGRAGVDRAIEILSGCSSVVVALSGGVDSAVLLALAVWLVCLLLGATSTWLTRSGCCSS